MQHKKLHMSQYFTGSQIKNVSVAASIGFLVMIRRNLQYDKKEMSCDKINLRRDKNCTLTWCFNLSCDII